MPICAERQRIYDAIVSITDEIGKLSLTSELANLNGSITREQAAEMVIMAEKENPKLFNNRTSDFIRMYRANGAPKIFGNGDDFYEYDPEEINPLYLTILFILTYGRVTDHELFCHYHDFCDGAEEFGYTKIAKFLRKHYISQTAPSHNIEKIFSD